MEEHDEIREAVRDFELVLEAIFHRHHGESERHMVAFVLKNMATCFAYYAACALRPESKPALLALVAVELGISFTTTEVIKREMRHEQNP